MKIAVEKRIGQTRAAAFSDDDLPVSVFIWRDRKLDPALRSGDVVPAIVRSVDKSSAECFVELETGEGGYFNLNPSKPVPVEGAHINVRIRSEAWAEKIALVQPVTDAAHLLTGVEAFQAWKAGLGSTGEFEEIGESEARTRIQDALDDALLDTVGLPSGGCLHIDQTRALVAVDVDRSGRKLKLSNADLNREALRTTARMISLKRLSGLIVVDLVGSVRKEAGKAMATEMRDMLRLCGIRQVKILPPSVLGLMEMSVPRTYPPINSYDYSSCPEDRRMTETGIELLKQLEELASENRTARIEVEVRPDLADHLQRMEFNLFQALEFEFGARFSLKRSADCLSPFLHRVLS